MDNKVGSTIGADALVRAAPDGYTVGTVSINNVAIAPHLWSNVTYNPAKDFSYIGAIPDLPALGDDVAVQFDSDTALPVREVIPGLGHAIEFRVFRSAGVLHLDWWYDTTRLDRYTVEELTEQFPLALFEMTSDAAAPV